MPNIKEFVGPIPEPVHRTELEKVIGKKPCSKCDEDIRTAEKVHLLIKSAEASANQGNDSDAVDKYNKAKTYCTSTCGCGC